MPNPRIEIALRAEAGETLDDLLAKIKDKIQALPTDVMALHAQHEIQIIIDKEGPQPPKG